MDECGGLENRYDCKIIASSNPALSANKRVNFAVNKRKFLK